MVIAATPSDDRSEPRDEVHHRSSAMLADERRVTVLIVNLSPSGLMIRSDVAVGAGDWLFIRLPAVGDVRVVVRWALGAGRPDRLPVGAADPREPLSCRAGGDGRIAVPGGSRRSRFVLPLAGRGNRR